MRALEAYLNVDKGGGLTSLPPSAGNLRLNDRRDFIAMFQKTIDELHYLGEYRLARFYSDSMQAYLAFIGSKNR